MIYFGEIAVHAARAAAEFQREKLETEMLSKMTFKQKKEFLEEKKERELLDLRKREVRALERIAAKETKIDIKTSIF